VAGALSVDFRSSNANCAAAPRELEEALLIAPESNRLSKMNAMEELEMSTDSELLQTDSLCVQLLGQQPQSRSLLERLIARLGNGKGGAFAAIKQGRCSACNLKVAAARLQKARSGEFINCGSCSRFLYFHADQ
jgi:hypothetical protein